MYRQRDDEGAPAKPSADDEAEAVDKSIQLFDPNPFSTQPGLISEDQDPNPNWFLTATRSQPGESVESVEETDDSYIGCTFVTVLVCLCFRATAR